MMDGTISTGSLRLDIALGIGGIPRGEFIEISGAISSGKTTLCQHIIAEAQKTGEPCAWIDVDHSLVNDYILRCGVNPEFLFVSEPESAEQALGILEILAGAGSMAVVVLDSVTSLISQDELIPIDDQSSHTSIDSQLSRTLRKLDPLIHNNRTTVIFTDQVTTGISSVYHNLAQNPARLALKLHASLRLDLRSIQHLQKNGTAIGNRIEARVIKNHFAPCLHRTEFDIMYNNGINKAGEIFELGTQLQIIFRQNSDYFFNDHKLGAKQSEALIFFKENQPIIEEIEKIIRLKIFSEISPAATDYLLRPLRDQTTA